MTRNEPSQGGQMRNSLHPKYYKNWAQAPNPLADNQWNIQRQFRQQMQRQQDERLDRQSSLRQIGVTSSSAQPQREYNVNHERPYHRNDEFIQPNQHYGDDRNGYFRDPRGYNDRYHRDEYPQQQSFLRNPNYQSRPQYGGHQCPECDYGPPQANHAIYRPNLNANYGQRPYVPQTPTAFYEQRIPGPSLLYPNGVFLPNANHFQPPAVRPPAPLHHVPFYPYGLGVGVPPEYLNTMSNDPRYQENHFNDGRRGCQCQQHYDRDMGYQAHEAYPENYHLQDAHRPEYVNGYHGPRARCPHAQRPQVHRVSCNEAHDNSPNQSRFYSAEEALGAMRGSVVPRQEDRGQVRPAERQAPSRNQRGIKSIDLNDQAVPRQNGKNPLVMPTIIGQTNNERDWRVELNCPGWQNSFLQVELMEEFISPDDKENLVYVRGRREVSTEAGPVLVKFEKKFKAPTQIDRNSVRAEMTSKGKLTIIAPKK